MKTPSTFPVLDNRPIDQWKVTELKEELKRRKLTTRGLKDELVRRLDESLRLEMEAQKEEPDNGVNDPAPFNVAEAAVAQQSVNETSPLGLGTPNITKETVGHAGDGMVDLGYTGDGFTNMGGVAVQVHSKDNNVELPIEGKGQEEQHSGLVSFQLPDEQDSGLVSVQPLEEQVSGLVSVQPPEEQDSGLVSVQPPEEQDSGLVSVQLPEVQDSVLVNFQPPEDQDSGLVSVQPPEVGTLGTNDVPVTGLGYAISESLPSENAVGDKGLPDGEMERGNEGSRSQEQAEDVKPPHEDGKLYSPDSNNQVSEVSSSLGFPIKSNSISTDSVSLNETNDLKDNIIADNDVKLESDVKPEMVQPSSSEFVPAGGESHPSDVEEPQENKVSVQDTDNNVTNADVSMKNYSADLGSSEKLNLDRSSGDDSMEEDALESKNIDSNYNFEEVVERTEKNEFTPIEEVKPVATMDIDEPEKERGSYHENDVVDSGATDKRKLSDQDAVLNNEPTKRQRRWKSESNNVKEPQISNVPLQAAVKDVPQPAILKRNLSGSNSIGSVDEAPKEREVPPSANPATDSLRIDRFLRPFTLKAVQELLGKTGTVTSFWMDHIKTHCYVTYSSVEEAMETRNAVYNLQWPPNGGRHLVAEFVDPEEVKARLEKPPAPPVTPVSSGPALPEPASTMPQPSPRQQSLRQQMSQQPTLPPPPPLSNPPQAREYAVLPPPPAIEKVEAPILTLDDLFKKTKATPRIYYLPLSDEQVAGVLEARRRNSKE